jgi:hypothetical protein
MKQNNYCSLIGVITGIMLAMTVTLIACSNPSGGGGGGTTAATPEQKAAELAGALGGKATAQGATVKITGSVPLQKNLIVPAGVTLDVTAASAELLLGSVTLTVNGTVNAGANKIRLENTGGARTVETLVIDATINGTGIVNLTSKGSLHIVGDGGDVTKKLTLDGATLVGLPDNNAPLITVNNGGEFDMKSGKITGNTNTRGSGGGVVVSGTFTMDGGEISGNTSKSNNNQAGGGGVSVGNNGNFTMTDGTISGNTTYASNNTFGGGVHVYGGVFTMKGGAISGNTTATAATATIGSHGGGVHVSDYGTFTMEGGIISGNAATVANNRPGGGVFVNSGAAFIMKGGVIYGKSDNSTFPAGANPSLANSAGNGASLVVVVSNSATAKYGTGEDIIPSPNENTDDTLTGRQ